MKDKTLHNLQSSAVLTDILKDMAQGLSDNLVRDDLNPFQSFSHKLRLNEYENKQLNKFLEKAFTAETIEELSKTVDEALESGIRINARNEDKFSFSSVVVLKMHYSNFIASKQKNIIKKLALNCADFDELGNFDKLGSKKIIEICNKIQEEVEPQVRNRLAKLREVAENATTTGSVKNVEIDNQTFHVEFSQDSKVEVAKVVEGARSLGLSNGHLELGNNIIKIGKGELEIKTGKNGERNYADVSDNSSFTITFSTSLGELNVIVYQDVKNYDQIQVEAENKELWNKLQKTGEIVGQGCLFGGMSVKAAIENESFVRSGRWGNSRSTEIIKCTKPQSSETIWVDKIKSSKTTSVEHS